MHVEKKTGMKHENVQYARVSLVDALATIVAREKKSQTFLLSCQLWVGPITVVNIEKVCRDSFRPL